LTRDPYRLSVDQIGALCPAQVRLLYFRDDLDEESGLPAALTTARASGTPVTAQSLQDTFWKVHRDWRGLSEEETQKRWDAHQQQLQANRRRRS
jgi:hypothetical protein